jgi:hypothetical protein
MLTSRGRWVVWLIIVAVLALAVGPIFYLLPSAQDRFLAGLRQHARQLGFSMQLQRLAKLNPTAAERVSASGQQRAPVVECMCYQWLIREPIHAPLDIVLRRLPDSVTVSVQEAIAGWGVAKSGERRNTDHAGLLEIAQHLELQHSLFECVRNLPDAVLALGIEARSVSIYWHEEAAVPRSADEKGRLADGKNLIEDLRGRLQTLALAIVQTYGERDNAPS